MQLDAGALAKYTALFEQSCQQAGGVSSLDKASAGLSKSGLPVDVLLRIWALVDLDGDDRLCLSEYLMCCSLIAHCVRTGEQPPATLPAQLRASAYGGSAPPMCGSSAAAPSAAPPSAAPPSAAPPNNVASIATPALDHAAVIKYTALFEQSCQQAGGVSSLDKASAGLSKSGLPVDVLLRIWALVDLDGDDRLCLSEYLMCCSLIAHCVRTGEQPPATLPAQLRASAYGGSAPPMCGSSAAAPSAAPPSAAPPSAAPPNNVASIATPALDHAAVTKYTALFEQSCQQAGGVSSLDKASAGLSKSGLPVDVLLRIWALVDLDGDDRLCLSEYLMCCSLIAHCVRTGEQPPATLPAALAQSLAQQQQQQEEEEEVQEQQQPVPPHPPLMLAAAPFASAVPPPFASTMAPQHAAAPSSPALASLLEMGFSAEEAESALAACGGDAQQAATRLMDTAAAAPAPPSSMSAAAFGAPFGDAFGAAFGAATEAPPPAAAPSSATQLPAAIDSFGGEGFGGTFGEGFTFGASTSVEPALPPQADAQAPPPPTTAESFLASTLPEAGSFADAARLAAEQRRQRKGEGEPLADGAPPAALAPPVPGDAAAASNGFGTGGIGDAFGGVAFGDGAASGDAVDTGSGATTGFGATDAFGCAFAMAALPPAARAAAPPLAMSSNPGDTMGAESAPTNTESAPTLAALPPTSSAAFGGGHFGEGSFSSSGFNVGGSDFGAGGFGDSGLSSGFDGGGGGFTDAFASFGGLSDNSAMALAPMAPCSDGLSGAPPATVVGASQSLAPAATMPEALSLSAPLAASAAAGDSPVVGAEGVPALPSDAAFLSPTTEATATAGNGGPCGAGGFESPLFTASSCAHSLRPPPTESTNLETPAPRTTPLAGAPKTAPLHLPAWPSWLPPTSAAEMRGIDALFVLLGGAPPPEPSADALEALPPSGAVPATALAKLLGEIAALLPGDGTGALGRVPFAALLCSLRVLAADPSCEPPPAALAAAVRRARVAAEAEAREAEAREAEAPEAEAPEAEAPEAHGAPTTEAAALAQRVALPPLAAGAAAAAEAAIAELSTAAAHLSVTTSAPVAPAARLPLPSNAHKQRYSQIFTVLHTQRDAAGVGRDKAFSVLKKSGLPEAELGRIWALSDVGGDGLLDLDEFILAMHLTNARVKAGVGLPDVLPPELRPSGR